MHSQTKILCLWTCMLGALNHYAACGIHAPRDLTK
jgi:hypothetical protein